MIASVHKIAAEHRNRIVYVYVRQSTMQQVRENRESHDRQYGLVHMASELGWDREQIEVVDDDLGFSATEVESRGGWQKMVTDVGLGRVGMILALEASRLARNNAEWYRLMDLCAVCGTLIADGAGIYDPRIMEDRFVLGLKGSLSEMELHTLRDRLLAGARNKAKRGDLLTRVAVGFMREGDEIRKDPNPAVRSALRTVFEKFEELGSARAVWRWMRQSRRQIPSQDVKTGKFQWAAPHSSSIVRILKHPIYAGAYVYGRKQTRQEVRQAAIVKRVQSVKPDEWHVVLPKHHEGYISWAQYQANQQRLRKNRTAPEGQPEGAVREGRALLQGLVWCGRCGRQMYTRYGRRGNYYACLYVAQRHGGPRCQGIGQRDVDVRVGEVFLEAISPAQLEISLETVREIEERAQRERAYWTERVEQARYEADRVHRQYNAVEPENRSVARELERQWEEKLRAAAALERQGDVTAASKARKVDEATAREIRALAGDLPGVWNAPTTTPQDRKLLLRELIQEVWLTRDAGRAEVEIKIVWKSHHQTTVRMPIRRAGRNRLSTRPEVVEEVRVRAPTHSDAEIAKRLNAQGWRTGRGREFTPKAVRQLRWCHKIPSGCPMAVKGAATRGDGRMTLQAAVEKLGVRSDQLYGWIRRGGLDAIQDTPGGMWWIRLESGPAVPPPRRSRRGAAAMRDKQASPAAVHGTGKGTKQ